MGGREGAKEGRKAQKNIGAEMRKNNPAEENLTNALGTTLSDERQKRWKGRRKKGAIKEPILKFKQFFLVPRSNTAMDEGRTTKKKLIWQ